MGRLRYIGIRTVQTVIVIWFVITFLFLFFRMMPGSFASIMLGAGAGPETVEAFRAAWGLNDPLYVQYWRYMINIAHLDFGTSLQFRTSVLNLAGIRIFNTFILVGPALTFAYILGSILGTVIGMNRGTKLEEYGIVPAVVAGTIPEFFTGILLIVLFASTVGIALFPPNGMIDSAVLTKYATEPWWRPYLTANFGWHYVLPFTTIVLRYLYNPMLVMRNSIVEQLGQNFNYYYRITGISKRNRFKHIFRHSVIPVLTLYPVSMTRALSGLVLIETVFNWPGIGYTLVQAVLARDFPLIQFVFIVTAIFVIVSNYAIDILYGYIDPRITVGESNA